MINLDAMNPMQQDPSEMFAVDSDYEYNNDSEDYDDDFIDALMILDDGPVDEAPNSDSFPVNEATFPGIDMMHVEGRYLVLESQDIVCGGMHQTIHHPGNALLERIVADFILPYGLATKEPERQTLLGEILSQIEMACYSAGWRPPRYVFPAVTSDGLAYYQAASRHAITEEIKCSIKSHFNIIPMPNDVLFGRGQPCRDFPGNIRFRTYIDNQSRRYTSARPNDRRRMIQLTRESVTAVGGRFLLPFDKARPSDGCVEAPDDAIRRKIAHLYRDNPNPRQEGVEMVQAHPVDEVLPAPMFYHWGPDAPSVSSSTKDAETTQTTEASAKILDGGSITPSSDQSTGTTASSRPSFGGLILDLKTFFFKWPKILLCLTGIVIAIVVGISLATISGKEEVGLTTLQVIQRRGRLICGVTNQIGYSTQNISTKLWMGFEVDICRAQAAAIFGKDRFYPLSPRASEPVEYVDLLPSERFHALKNKTVDILLAGHRIGTRFRSGQYCHCKRY